MKVIERASPLHVNRILVGSSKQQLFNALCVPMVAEPATAAQKRRLLFMVPSINIGLESRSVDYPELVAGCSGMVQGCTSMDVTRVYSQALPHEVHEADRLITLSADVQHIDAVLVLGEAVGTMLDQKADQGQVAVKGGKM